jgi:hypothetical protein
MENRGLTLGIGVVLAVAIGIGGAVGYHQLKGNQTAVSQPTPSPQTSPSEVPSPSPSPSPSPAAPTPSPSPAPSPSPSPSPAPVAPPPPPSRAAAYPAQISAGSTYPYSGSGTLFAGAQDSADTGTSICAGINDSTHAFPAGYEGVFFVAIQFTDGNRISAGFQRSAAGRQDFGTVQNDRTGFKTGNPVPGPASGSHVYCVTHSGSNWAATDDGKTIFSTTVETAAVSNGQLLFESSAQHFDAATPVTPFSLVVPGFHDITVDGNAPTQLRGFTITV